MKNAFLLILILIFIEIVSAQEFMKIKVYLNDFKDVSTLAYNGIAVDDAFFEKKDFSLSLFISKYEFDKIKNLGLKTEILIEDWDEYYKSTKKITESEKNLSEAFSISNYGVSEFGYGSMGGFYTLEEVYNRLDSMYVNYPALITQKIQIGTSVENRPIYAVKISDNAGSDEDEPEVFYNALTHAREPQGMMVLMYFMYYLLENYGTDPEATYLVDNRELYFVPVINVDGYEYNRLIKPDGGGSWRKNRSLPYGVDLNRNFGFMWGYNNLGSSSNQSHDTYRGTSAFSEPETQAIRDFCNAHNFKTALNYHTYSNLLISPWGYINEETPDSNIFREYSSDMTKYNNYTWGISKELLYEVNGDSDDWMYGEQNSKSKIISMTPEVGNDNDGFWPAQNRIFPLAQENLYPNLYLAWAAGGYVKLQNVIYSKQYFIPGENVTLQPVIKNKGLESCNNIKIELVSLNNNIVINTPAVSINSIAARTTFTIETPFNITISNTATIQEEMKLVFRTYTDNVTMSVDTINFIIGIPQFAFIDSTSNYSYLWSSTGNTHWDNTSAVFYSSPNCYTDSKYGNYPASSSIVMTLKDQIDLTDFNNPILTFRTKYEIENNWDYGQVKISTNNGALWKALHGKYTNLSTGDFQPPDEPVYDGNQNTWVKEEINLSEYGGQKIKLSFELHSDEYDQRDGWYVDDIAIVYYSNLPVELISFTASAERENIKLSWSTASELNNKGFQIQKGKDKTTWNDVAFVNGSGTSNQLNKYIYFDKEPINGKSYYRILQHDYDGTYKEIAVTEVNAKGIYDYSLSQNYPNPFNPKTVIAYTVAEPGKVSIKIYDILGNEVITVVNEIHEAGRYKKEISVDKSGLTSGIYFYILRVNDYSEVKKMIILK